MENKICNKCKIDKPLSEFGKAIGYKGGVRPTCKKCKYEYDRQWLKSDPENQKRTNQSQKQWYIRNGLEYSRNWRDENRETINDQRREVRAGIREAKPSILKGTSRPEFKGENNPNWKGGVSSERAKAMRLAPYREWRFSVFKRDNFTCVLCQQNPNKIQAHHIIPWSEDKSLRYAQENGVTVCIPCHNLIRGNENSFVDKFNLYVVNSNPTILTDEEKDQFKSIEVKCHQCQKDFIRPNWKKPNKIHFCNIQCKKEYEKTIGHNWGGGRKKKMSE